MCVFRNPKTLDFVRKNGFCDGFDKAFQNFNGLRPYPRAPGPRAPFPPPLPRRAADGDGPLRGHCTCVQYVAHSGFLMGGFASVGL